MKNMTRMALGLGAAAVVAAGGSAFTAGNTLGGNNTVGYGTDTVTGAVSTGIEHALSLDGQYVASSTITFAPDANTDPQVMAGFGALGSSAMTNCTVTPATKTATDVYTAVCTYTATQYTTTAAADFRVAVH